MKPESGSHRVPSGVEVLLAPDSPLDHDRVVRLVEGHLDVASEQHRLHGGKLQLSHTGPIFHQSRRTLLTRVEDDGESFVVKEYVPAGGRLGWRGQLTVLVRPDRGLAAFHVGLGCKQRGLSVPAPLALLRQHKLGRSYLIMELFDGEGAAPLHLFLRTLAAGESGADQQRRELAREVGRYIARMHGLGIDPSDLAAQNVLVRHRADGQGFDVALIDWDDVRLRPRVSRRRTIRHFIQLADLPESTPLKDRLRGLRAYRQSSGRRLRRRELDAIVAGIRERNLAKIRRQQAREKST